MIKKNFFFFFQKKYKIGITAVLPYCIIINLLFVSDTFSGGRCHFTFCFKITTQSLWAKEKWKCGWEEQTTCFVLVHEESYGVQMNMSYIPQLIYYSYTDTHKKLVCFLWFHWNCKLIWMYVISFSFHYLRFT